MQREGRVHTGDRREEPASRDEEVGDVVGAAVAVGDRVFRAFPHDRAAEEVRETRAGIGPGLIRARRLDDAVALGADVVEELHRVLVEAVNHAREREAVGVLALGEHDAVLGIRQFLRLHANAREPARGALHEIVQRVAEELRPRVGEAEHVVRLHRDAHRPGVAAESRVAVLDVAVLRHAEGPGGAHVVLGVLLEHRKGGKRDVRRDVLTHPPARVREALRMPVVRGVEKDARVRRREGREHDDVRVLLLALLRLVVVLDPGSAVAFRVDEHARHVGMGADLDAGFPRDGQISDLRIDERARRAARLAPAVVDARGPAVVGHAVDRHGHGRGAHADFPEALGEQLGLAEPLHRRHRIGVARRAPDLGDVIAREADFLLDAVVVRPHVGVRDRPIEPAPVLGLDAEILFMEARPVGELVHRRAAQAPARLEIVGNGVLSFRNHRHPAPLQAPRPDLRAHQVVESERRTHLEDHDLLPGLAELGGEQDSGGAAADDHDIDFFVGHGYHLLIGMICGMYGMPRRSKPSTVP